MISDNKKRLLFCSYMKALSSVFRYHYSALSLVTAKAIKFLLIPDSYDSAIAVGAFGPSHIPLDGFLCVRRAAGPKTTKHLRGNTWSFLDMCL